MGKRSAVFEDKLPKKFWGAAEEILRVLHRHNFSKKETHALLIGLDESIPPLFNKYISGIPRGAEPTPPPVRTIIEGKKP